jgi:hypothetical protein
MVKEEQQTWKITILLAQWPAVLFLVREAVVFNKQTDSNHVGFEVFTAVIMKSIIFWDMMLCSPLSFNRRFGGIYRLHLQGRRNKFSRNQVEGASATYPSRTSEHVIRGRAHYQLGASHPATQHHHPLHQTHIHGLHHQGGDWDWAPSQQYEQGGWLLSKQVLETSYLLLERSAEASPVWQRILVLH